MSIRIPIANTNKVMLRNVVKQAASDGFLPVIALEAFVEGGRTFQAYKRGGFDEARERITEEFSGAVFWLGGVTALNALFEKLGQKILDLPKKQLDIAKDDVRNPLASFLANEKHVKSGAEILDKTMARFKFAKVISSILIANAFIGFGLPKINQAITRSYHKKKAQAQPETPTAAMQQRPTMNTFAKDKENKKDVPFGMKLDLLTIANKFENDRNYKLLAVDAGTASGRAISARNNDERVEILFRDLGSIYFYMFNMNNMNKWLNKLEQNGNSSRLDAVSSEFAASYMREYVDPKGKGNAVSVEKFVREFLGQGIDDVPESLKSKFEGKNIKTIKLAKFKEELRNLKLVPEDKIKNIEKIADAMSELQPKLLGDSILTYGQVKDILNGGHINNPKFLIEFYKNKFGEKFMDKYLFIAQNDLDAAKKELEDFVKSVVETAKKTDAKEITVKLINKASNKNLKMNALNWGAGFVTSALFLSTIIPKLQYKITKWRTGSDAFPGTQEYRNQESSAKK